MHKFCSFNCAEKEKNKIDIQGPGPGSYEVDTSIAGLPNYLNQKGKDSKASLLIKFIKELDDTLKTGK